ncbi:DNA repair protein RecN [bacterium]|nr:DNA repair protein RecN [bacterium]
MLDRIFIKNYILISEAEFEFSKGLNIIAGETGAGKSILINAIDIAFGAKAGKEVIKTGEEKAIIELTIRNDKYDLNGLFEEYGIENDGTEVILSREITQNSSRSRVNGSLVNQEFLKRLREMFLDIHSQHQTYSLLQSKNHISLLDSYIKNPLLNEYQKEFSIYKDMISKLEKLKEVSEKTEEQIEFLKFQVNEIDSANITSINEDTELENELSILENSEKLKEYTGSSYWTLTGDDHSIVNSLYDIKNSISKASNLDSNLEISVTEIIEIIDKIKALSSELRDYSSSMENNNGRIDEIQERLFILDKLKKKYGGNLEKVIATQENLTNELNGIEFSTQNIKELETAITTKEKLLNQLAEQISSNRKEEALKLSEKIVEKLEKLELPKVRFEINFELTALQINGIDKIEFMISTNVSEGLKPIAKVASGGEISRIMLAIKSIFAQADDIDTVIFDEIDTGISGKTSQSVAEEVKNIAKYMQIIMITHQAIIASKADKYFYVKKSQNEKTTVDISVLASEAKLKAIAELASGIVDDESLKFAQMLVNS